MRKSAKFLGALAVAVLATVGASAYTAGTGQDATQVVGYGSTTINGATVNSMTYNLSDAGDSVDTVTLVLADDTSASLVSIGFNGGTTTSCGDGDVTATVPLVPAGTDPVTAEVPAVPGFTTYTCKDGSSNFTQATAELASTAVVVN